MIVRLARIAARAQASRRRVGPRRSAYRTRRTTGRTLRSGAECNATNSSHVLQRRAVSVTPERMRPNGTGSANPPASHGGHCRLRNLPGGEPAACVVACARSADRFDQGRPCHRAAASRRAGSLGHSGGAVRLECGSEGAGSFCGLTGRPSRHRGTDVRSRMTRSRIAPDRPIRGPARTAGPGGSSYRSQWTCRSTILPRQPSGPCSLKGRPSPCRSRPSCCSPRTPAGR